MASIEYWLSKTGSWDRAESTYEVHGALPVRMLEGLRSSEYVHTVSATESKDAHGGIRVQVLMKENTLTTLPLFICPTILHDVEYRSVDSLHRFMFGMLVALFPEAIAHVPGREFRAMEAGRTSRDLYIHRIVKSWVSKTTNDALSKYLWEKWMQVTGFAKVDSLKRGAPTSSNVVGALVGNHTLAHHLVQVDGIENSKRG